MIYAGCPSFLALGSEDGDIPTFCFVGFGLVYELPSMSTFKGHLVLKDMMVPYSGYRASI